MGMTYKFKKAKRADLLGVKCMDDMCHLVLDSPDIGDHLDREDFVLRLMETNNTALLGDAEREVLEHDMKYIEECDMVVVSKPMVERAIKTLDELDDKVNSMPFDRSLAKDNPWCVGLTDAIYDDVSQHKYIEPLLSDRQVGHHGTYVFYAPSKEYLDILKEVYEVYGLRYYHYTFPWQSDEAGRFGSIGVKSVLRDVLTDMERDGGESVYFLRWY